jgi:Acyltransferase family
MILMQVFVFGAKDGRLGSPWPVDVGHMWFVEHLIIYSAAYALWRTIRPGRTSTGEKLADPPGTGVILAFALGLAVVTGVVRIWYPIDKQVYLLGFIRVAWADIPRDLSLFILGAVAYRHQWVTRFPTKAGMAWLGVGLFLAGLWYAYALWLKGALHISDSVNPYIIPVWESLLCLGMCIGLTVSFRERLNLQTRLSKWLAQGQYAAYIVHLPVVLGFQALLIGLVALPLAKFALVTVAAIPVTFGIAGVIRKPLHL